MVPASLHRFRAWLLTLPEVSAAPPHASNEVPRRASLVIHLVLLALVAAVYVRLGRDQWFFYDEWNLLVPGNEWDLLAPHNGHLSFSLVLITDLLKGAVGLHAYWPYLVITVLVHLSIAHLLWRLMNRIGVHPLVAHLVAILFALLAVGADNSLWAFQTGFIAPVLLGLVAVLIVERQYPGWKPVAAIAALLLFAISFSGTAIPMIFVVLVLVISRRGWKPAFGIAVAVLAPYVLWRAVFLRGAQPTDAFAASSPKDFLVRVPEQALTGLIDSIGKLGPFDAVAPSLFVLLVVWALLSLRSLGRDALPTSHALLAGALVFAVLTAVSRLKLGGDEASAGRYVYIYAALLFPAIGVAITQITRRSRWGLGVVAFGLAVLCSFNGVQLASNGLSQAGLEQFTKRSLSAALDLSDRYSFSPSQHPLPIIAPTLTMGQLEELEREGALTAGDYDEAALLSTEVNLLLTSRGVAASEEPTRCARPVDGMYVLGAGMPHIVSSPADTAQKVTVTVTRDGVSSGYTQTTIEPGVQLLVGFEDSEILLAASEDYELCVAPVTDAR